jgi:hypothetical protein
VLWGGGTNNVETPAISLGGVVCYRPNASGSDSQLGLASKRELFAVDTRQHTIKWQRVTQVQSPVTFRKVTLCKLPKRGVCTLLHGWGCDPLECVNARVCLHTESWKCTQDWANKCTHSYTTRMHLRTQLANTQLKSCAT